MPHHISQDAFLTELNKLMKMNRDKGTLYITFKGAWVVFYSWKFIRFVVLSHPPKKIDASSSASSSSSGSINPLGEPLDDRECLVRARVGKKRLATVVRLQFKIFFIISGILRCFIDVSWLRFIFLRRKANTISWKVKSKDIIKFQQTYTAILKANMDSLKKREKRNKKAKASWRINTNK